YLSKSMNNKNYYNILEITTTATLAEIKKAYRNLAKTHHPDRGGSEEKMKQLNEAYEVLSDEGKRKQYDGGANVSPDNYGYDYGEEIGKGDAAVKKYPN